MAYSNYGIKDAGDIFLKNLATGNVIFIPFFNKFGIDLKGDSVFALKKGQKSIKWNKTMEGTFTGELEILNNQIMALLLGCEVLKTNVTIFKKEDITVSVADTATLAEAPNAGSLSVMVMDDDGAMASKVFEVITTGTVATNQVKLTGSGLTFFTGEAPIGTKLFVTYLVDKADVNQFTVYGNANSVNYSLYANVECKMEGSFSPK